MRSCNVRNNLACINSGSSPSSSRKNVPPSANSKSPIVRCRLPVNAPFSWPKNSASSRFSGIAPQSTGTNGPCGAAAAAMNAARDQFLAGARLADHQYVDPRVGDLLDHLEYFAHRRASADDVVEAIGAFDLPAQQLAFGPQVGCWANSRAMSLPRLPARAARQKFGHAEVRRRRRSRSAVSATTIDRQRAIAAAGLLDQALHVVGASYAIPPSASNHSSVSRRSAVGGRFRMSNRSQSSRPGLARIGALCPGHYRRSTGGILSTRGPLRR